MIRDSIKRLAGRVGDGSAAELSALRAEVARLEQRNERLRRALRTCTDCEYRIEVVSRRDARGLNADGTSPS